jgi:hypothetical protein
MTNRSTHQSGQSSHGMTDPRKNGSMSDDRDIRSDKGLREDDLDTTPVKSTDHVSNQTPGRSQGNISNRGGR